MSNDASAISDPIMLSPYIPLGINDYPVYITSEGYARDYYGTYPLTPFAFSSIEEEELSWHDTCYIHSGLNPFLFFRYTGKGFLDFLEAATVSTFRKFPIGKARHAIFTTPEGKIIFDGIVMRRGEDEFITSGLPGAETFIPDACARFDFTCEDKGSDYFFFQLCGPRSLEIIEAAARADLHDIKFMYLKDTEIAGKKVFILRTGMAGTLGYEVHGNAVDALAVYNTLMEKGAAYGIVPLGRHAYRNTHTEGSIAQMTIHYAPDIIMPREIKATGSLDRDSGYFFVSPIDLGWENLISFDHEFPGKEILRAELEGHHNTMVHLIWNPDDIVKVVRSYFDKEGSCEIMDMVEDFDLTAASSSVHIDAVYDGDKLIGGASGRMLSMKNHEMMSMCVIDQDYAVEGRSVEVLWGAPGTRQMRIRATVMLAPYIKECRNDSFDVENIPHPVFD